jgi:hypothetical protein
MGIRPGAQVRRTRLGIVVTSCTVVACAPVPDQAGHDVAYYRQHADERHRQLTECANDPGAIGSHPDCVNAREAERMEDVGALRRLPPLDLPVSPAKSPRE